MSEKELKLKGWPIGSVIKPIGNYNKSCAYLITSGLHRNKLPYSEETSLNKRSQYQQSAVMINEKLKEVTIFTLASYHREDDERRVP